jgi:N-dimethylarginine dimethylaminohydrolase
MLTNAALIEPRPSLRDLFLKPVFLMCPPTFFNPTIEAHGGCTANLYMHHTDFSAAKAEAQWHGYKDKLQELGATVILASPKANALDQIYTADPQAFFTDVEFSANGAVSRFHFKSMTSRFTNAEREIEKSRHLIASFDFVHDVRSAAQGSAISIGATFESASFNTEGSGDNVYDAYRGLWWSGYSTDLTNPHNGRSDSRSHKQLARLTNRDVLGLKVVKPYYHIDTSNMPLPRGHVLSHKAGITPESYVAMKKVAFGDFGLPESDYLISVDKADAEVFLCNLTAVNDRDLIVPDDASDKILARLANTGYNIHPLPYDEIRKGGGSLHCTANRINMIGPKGGTARDPDFYNRLAASL